MMVADIIEEEVAGKLHHPIATTERGGTAVSFAELYLEVDFFFSFFLWSLSHDSLLSFTIR